MSAFERHYRVWLPDEALNRASVEEQLGELIYVWSGKWFAGDAWTVAGGLSRGLPAATGLRWTGLADGIGIGVEVETARLLAGAMMGATPDPAFKSTNDLQLANGLADACLDDLRRMLAELFRLPSDCVWRDGDLDELFQSATAEHVTIGSPRLPRCIRFAVTHELLVGRVKAGLRNRTAAIHLSTLSRGLGGQVVAVGVRVGACSLSLAELNGLSIGDVVVLDRPLDHQLELAIDGTPVALRCAIDAAESRLAIELAEPLVG